MQFRITEEELGKEAWDEVIRFVKPYLLAEPIFQGSAADISLSELVEQIVESLGEEA